MSRSSVVRASTSAKFWPRCQRVGLLSLKMEVRRITLIQCRDWAARFAKGNSPTRFNNTLAILRHVLDIAIECGVIYSNPASTLRRRPIRQKALALPSRAQFAAFIQTMGDGWDPRLSEWR